MTEKAKRRKLFVNGKIPTKGVTPYKWYNPDIGKYRERKVSFTDVGYSVRGV